MRGLRLRHLRDECEAIGQEMEQERGRFDRLRDDSAKPRAVSSFNLFQTPKDIAKRMVELLSPNPDSSVLEPSAGMGRLYHALLDYGHYGPVVLVEQSPVLCRELYETVSLAELKQGDFLSMDLGKFDFVLMNPPFKRWSDIKHVRHALTMLKPGGRLVSLCYAGPRQIAEFVDADYFEILPKHSFKESGTYADVAMLMYKKS